MSNQQTVTALEHQQQSDLLTIDSLAAKYKVSPSNIIEMLNAGYSLQDVGAALDKNSDAAKLLGTLQQLFPGKGKLYVPPTVTDVTYGVVGVNLLLEGDAWASVTGNVYGDKESLHSVTGSVYGRAKRSLTSSGYDELALKNQHVKLDQAPYSVSTGVEDISMQDGSLNLKVTDIGIPSRNGFSFKLTRSYNSNAAELYDKNITQTWLDGLYFSPLMNVKVYVLEPGVGMRYLFEYGTSSNYVYFNNQLVGEAPKEYAQMVGGRYDDLNAIMEEKYADRTKKITHLSTSFEGKQYLLELYPTGSSSAYYIYDMKRLGITYDSWTTPRKLDRFMPLGKGWRWDIPYIQTSGYNKYVSMPGGSVYTINGNDQIENYPWGDVRFTKDTSKIVNDVRSEYALLYKNGTKYFFSYDGELLRQEDAYGNFFDFYYYRLAGRDYVLFKVLSSTGQQLQFLYGTNDIVVSNGIDRVTYQKGWVPGASDLQYLQSVKDVMERNTYYSYHFGESKFTVVGTKKPDTRNDFALIKQIHHPTGAKTEFTYDSLIRELGSATKQLQYRIIERKDIIEYVNLQSVVSNYHTFQYESDPYSYYGDRMYSTSMTDGLLTTSFKYKKLWNDGNTRFYNLENIQDAGTTQHISQQAYDEASGNPNPIQIVTKKRISGAESPALTVNRQYDRNGNITSETNNMGASTVTTYDSTFALPQTVTTKFDANQQSVTRYVRNGQGSVIESKTYANAEGGPLLRHRNFEYDGFGNVTKVTTNNSSKPTVFRYQYGPEYQHAFLTQQDVEVTNADGRKSVVVEKAQYDPLTGRLLAYTDGLNQTTSYTYDRLGRTTSVTMPNQAQASYVYNDSTNHIMAKNTLGEVQQVWFDPLGRKLKETQGLGEVKYGYDERTSRLLWQDDAYGNRTWYSYDAFGRIKQTTYADQTSETVQYDDAQLTELYTDAEANQKLKRYDPLQRLVAEEVWVKKEQTFKPEVRNEYNSIGKIAALTDGNSNRTTYAYNSLGELTGVTDASQETIQYTYDLLGNVTKLQFPGSQTVTKAYDELGRVITETNGTGQVEKYQYDANGNVVQYVDKAGVATTQQFDTMNNLLRSATADLIVQYTYDTEGKRLSMVDQTGTTSYNYQLQSGYLTEIQYPDGVHLANSYDLRKKTGYSVRQISKGFHMTVRGQFDSRNRVTDLSISSSSIIGTPHVTYSYWKNGDVMSRAMASAFSSNMQYDNGRLILIQHRKSGQVVNYFSYEYDLNGNIQYRNENNYLTHFSYTPLDQVKTSSEFNERYTYDGRYNRLTLESSRELPIQEAQYEYNQKNQLTKAIGSKGTASYSYNGDGLMVERAMSNARHRYYYNEDKRIVAEAVIEADGKPRILYVYIYDTNGAIIGRQDAASGKVQYYQLNGHGDVVALTDEQGSKLNEYRYDIWGLPLESKETVSNIFGYAGEYWDSISDLQYLRARWYDPSMGRFISEDKNQGKIEEPDTLNRYTYVENNPLNGVDPEGENKINCSFKCFSAGTQIQTDEGLKAIEDIKVGDKVLAKSEETGEAAYKAVEETFNRTADEVYVIEVKQEKITTTEEHPFWIVGKGWVEAGDLVVEDVLVDRDGKEYPIESITVHQEPTKVYNFRVQGYHNYFVTDLRIWTHNCGGGGFGRAGAGPSTSYSSYSNGGGISSYPIKVSTPAANTTIKWKNGQPDLIGFYKGKGDPKLSELHTKLDQLAEKHLLQQFREIDPNIKAGYTGSFKTGTVGNPNKPTFGQPINLKKYDIDYYIESDILFKKFGNSLKANPEFRKILSETPGFEGLKPNKEGFSIKFKPSSK
ncbi:hypothetical protein MH117_17000 [Paenibacillus sp. ACRRX]|uniref:polymorphic toxin-type HINT domain-containing protein n=1 Tax=Paenibacillus sp. ACRRX TaxID=2918206 RepID=UPI001EF4CAFD|nr:polymorphic toxin-type HINT domain-containing protein [Paenibacillus sp. ACRRX]MCG7409118.1 hypothetical protein [Paenibacillus sp. ACRRX]